MPRVGESLRSCCLSSLDFTYYVGPVPSNGVGAFERRIKSNGIVVGMAAQMGVAFLIL